MRTIRELLEDCANSSDQNIYEQAVASGNVLIPYLKNRGFSSDDMFQFVACLFKLFVSADRSTTRGEYNLYLSIFDISESDLSEDDFYEMTNGGADEDYIVEMKKVISSFPEDVYYACCQLGVAIMAADRRISNSEVELLERLLS